jgi:hypothetical protein
MQKSPNEQNLCLRPIGNYLKESLGLEEDEKSPARSENLSLAGTQ